MLKGCKIQIYPTKKQEEILLIYCKYSHIMRNFLVSKYEYNLPTVQRFGIKGYSENQFLQDFIEYNGEIEIPLPKRIIKGVIINYKQSVERFYNKISYAPKFHKYNPNKQSFYTPATNNKIRYGKISLPHAKHFSLVGMSKIKVDEKYLKKYTIDEIIEPRYTFIKGKWYISGAYKTTDSVKKDTSTTIGLDWGIKNFMTSSTGNFINYPKSVEREFYRIGNLSKRRDRKKLYSKNWNKVNNKIHLAYERLENLKRNFIEQTTTKLAKDANIAVEDLTNQKIRTSCKTRRRIQTIHPLSRFVEKLEWKTKKFGTNLYKVSPQYTSRTCSKCGLIKQNLSLADRIFQCSCGNIMDRDVNAACNIAARAIRSSF